MILLAKTQLPIPLLIQLLIKMQNNYLLMNQLPIQLPIWLLLTK